MDPKFSALVERMHPSFERLMKCEPHTGGELPPRHVPQRAVYLLSEGANHLYVGRTNTLSRRYRQHCRGNANDAPFAFKLARHATGNLRDKGAKGLLTRAQLALEPTFSAAFGEAKARVARMNFRWVGEDDANTQCLLEIYASIALGAEYNDFENH